MVEVEVRMGYWVLCGGRFRTLGMDAGRGRMERRKHLGGIFEERE